MKSSPLVILLLLVLAAIVLAYVRPDDNQPRAARMEPAPYGTISYRAVDGTTVTIPRPNPEP